MPTLPTVHQFPTFHETCAWLTQRACQCIWYLPDKRRCCYVQIQATENELVLQLATKLLQTNLSTIEQRQELAKTAELSCCARHHRNKMWGTNLANDLAIRWQNEIRETLSVMDSKITQKIKPTPVDQALTRTHPSRPVAFSKHVVSIGETLASSLLSAISPSASKAGSVYIFNYVDNAFRGMLKIGFTSRPVKYRLDEWTECGHGSPSLLKLYNNVRHPERVELLTHFELMKHWHCLRWCNFHFQAHTEWFKIGIDTANTVVKSWSLWMERANPYDRRGHLKDFWREVIQFLATYEIYITAELMMQIHEVEEGSIDLASFIDDNELGKQHDYKVKRDHLDESRGVSDSPCTKTDSAAEKGHELKPLSVKIEITEL